jgi:hypothetical protein
MMRIMLLLRVRAPYSTALGPDAQQVPQKYCSHYVMCAFTM